MSLQGFEDSHINERESNGESGQFSTEQKAGRPDHILMQGTMQFYEDLLDSLHDTYIVVFNPSGKHIEVWGSPLLKNKFNVDHIAFKGKSLDEVYSASVATLIRSKLEEVLQSANPVMFNFKTQLPGGLTWFEAYFVPLRSGKNFPTSSVAAYFRDISGSVEGNFQLSDLREQVKLLNDQSSDGIIVTNQKGIVTSTNTLLSEMSGYNSDAFTGLKLSHIPIVSPKNRHYLESMLVALNESRRIPEFEMEWKTASGLTRWSEVKTNILFNNQRLTGLQLRIHDITERKMIEQDLMKSKQAYKIIIENANEGIAIVSGNNIVFCNSRLLDLLDQTMDDLLKNPFRKYIHKDDQGMVEKYIEEVSLRNEIYGPGTFRIVKGENSFRWVECKFAFTEWNDTPATILYVYDVHFRKQKESQSEGDVELYKFISEQAAAFGQLDESEDPFVFISKKLCLVPGVKTVLMVSYEKGTNFPVIQHIEGPEDTVDALRNILNQHEHNLSARINPELIKSLSYGNLIKYYDGLFEKGYNLLPKSTLNIIQNSLNLSGIYLIGMKREQTVFGSAMIFMDEGLKPAYPKAIEMIARFGSAALQRMHSWNMLQDKERKYRHIFESYQDVYFRVDIDGTISEISPSVRKIGGYDPDDVQGKFVSHFLDKPSELFGISKILMKKGSVKDIDLSLLRKNGELVYASLNARILHDDKGRPAGFEGFIRDISQRRMMEERFQKSEEKFRTLADFTYDWEYWVSPEGEIIYMSPSCERVSGYSPEEFYNNPGLLQKITYSADTELFKKHSEVDESENKTDVLKIDYRIVSRSNEVRWINHICQEVYASSGKSLGRRISNRDITDQKLAQDELRNSEVRFKTLFFESPDPIFVQDYDGIILDVNPAACFLQKCQHDDLVGKNVIHLVSDKNREQMAEDFPKWITGELRTYRSDLIAADNAKVPVEIHGSKITYSGQNALLFIVRDISEIVEKEKYLRASVKKAEESDMLKSAFLANVSHEIRTPMNAIIGFSEILSNPDLSQEEREEFINYITQGGNTLLTLIEDIIDITKIEAGQIKVSFAETNIDPILDELYATFLKLKNKNGKKDVELRLNKPALKEGLIINTDPNRLRQILTNLLGNAIKFTRKGFIEFGFYLSDDDTIVFFVKDTGIGIPADKQAHIFERFGQVNDPRVSEFKGTGLGLSISKKLAELLGGDLTLVSKENVGSTFTLALPVQKEEIVETSEVKKVAERAFDWADKVFLIAEDSILNYTFLEALFQRTRVKLLWAKNGREAVEICENNDNIDLVLMDIKMPILNGLDAISEIKKFRPDLPIVVQTAYAMPEDRERSIEAGGDEHLTKPINASELFSTLSRFLN